MPGSQKPTPARPLKAVFVLDQLPMLAPMIAAWARAGHEIAAAVMPKRHNARLEWIAGRLFASIEPGWSLPGAMRRHAPGAAIAWLPQPIRWEKLSARLAALEADVLISAFFPRRIPDSLLAVFPHGGVNLHPSRLPHFRGPSPLHHLLLQDAWQEHGGVTLHRMSAGLDEGEIIAFAPLAEEHWHNRDTLDRALGGAMANLVANAVPAWCLGQAGSRPQPHGDFGWADAEPELTVDASWKVEHLRRLLAFFGGTQGVYLPLGERRLRLGTVLSMLGPPEGKPPRIGGGAIEFDLADARVACRRPSWSAHIASMMRIVPAKLRGEPPRIPFAFAEPSVTNELATSRQRAQWQQGVLPL